MLTHILIEAYCQLLLEDKVYDSIPKCKCNDHVPSYNCLVNKCPYLIFTSCENSLCYIGKDSVASEIISFGGDMINSSSEQIGVDLWEQISISKINEAYTQYMEKTLADSKLPKESDE